MINLELEGKFYSQGDGGGGDGRDSDEIIMAEIHRLCNKAKAQGGLLSDADQRILEEHSNRMRSISRRRILGIFRKRKK